MEWRYDLKLNETQNDIMKYLTEKLANGAKFISYGIIGKEVGRSRHSVRYSIDILVARGYLVITADRKLDLA